MEAREQLLELFNSDVPMDPMLKLIKEKLHLKSLDAAERVWRSSFTPEEIEMRRRRIIAKKNTHTADANVYDLIRKEYSRGTAKDEVSKMASKYGLSVERFEAFWRKEFPNYRKRQIGLIVKARESKFTRYIGEDGYWMVRRPRWYQKHGTPTIMHEHVVVYCEAHQLRELPEGYVIHHRNGIKTDNRPENLQMLSRPIHAMIHALKRASTIETVTSKRASE